MIEFAKFTDEEQTAVDRIIERAMKLDVGFERLTLRMDLAATHNQVPLNLDAFAAGDAFNFAHDIGGIARHMDRETGKLTDCFVPRFAI